MSKRKNKLNFTLKITNNGKVVDKVQTHSIRRLRNKIGTIKWQERHSSVYIRVSYGKVMSGNKLAYLWNDGDYDNEKDFNLALDAFLEE